MAGILYNSGSSKQRNLISGVMTTTTTSEPLLGADKYAALCLHAKIGSIGGTSPTFNVRLQQLAVDGTTWYDIASLTQMTGNGSRILGMVSGGNTEFAVTTGTLTAGTVHAVPFGASQRVHVTVGGTNPTAVVTVGIEYIE